MAHDNTLVISPKSEKLFLYRKCKRIYNMVQFFTEKLCIEIHSKQPKSEESKHLNILRRFNRSFWTAKQYFIIRVYTTIGCTR